MHIVITGGAGFLGTRLARELLARGRLSLAGSAQQTIQSITLVDRVAPPADLAADSRIHAVTGELNGIFEKKCGCSPRITCATRYHFSHGCRRQRRVRSRF